MGNKFINDGLEGITFLGNKNKLKPQKIEKYHLSLAGEYRVCAELLKRGVFATVTFGNMKSTDVVAYGANRRTAVIEVKSSNSKKVITGLYQKYKTPEEDHPTFWVLYSVLTDVNGEHLERFFILTHEEMAKEQGFWNQKRNLPYSKHAELSAKGVDKILIDQLQAYEKKWQKIVDYCSLAKPDQRKS